MDTITVEYELTPKDVEALVRYVRNRPAEGTPKPRTRRWAWIGLVGLILVFGLMRAMSPGEEEVRKAAEAGDGRQGGVGLMLLYLSVALLVIVVPWLLLRLMVLWSTRSRLRAAAAFKRRILVVGPEGYSETTPNLKTEATWDALQTIAETPAHLFMMIEPTRGYIVPRRVFASDDEWHHFVGLVRKYYSYAGSKA